MAVDADSIYWLALNRMQGWGPRTLQHALSVYHALPALFKASLHELQTLGLKPEQIQSMLHPDWGQAEKDLKWCTDNHCQILTWFDEDYPSLLKEIADPPPVLFVLGNYQLLKSTQLAIVGSRNPSPIGKEQAFAFAKHLASVGLTVTSGLAIGIDTESHKGALTNGKTIAVLGSGFLKIYPHSNRNLAKEIMKNGALVSEFSPDMPPKAQHFPMRNRVISGLSKGVLVVEAALKSGSLITARYALDQGREVFAMPGSIHNPLARGCHALIRQGATLVEEAADIYAEFGTFRAHITPSRNPGNLEKIDVKSRRLLAEIDYAVTALDVIMLRSGLTASEVSSMLLTLELQNCIKNVPGGYVRLVQTE